MASLFELDIAKLRGVGEKRAKLFCKLGAPTVGDLLRLYPRDYVDWTAPLPIAGAPLDGPVVVRGEIVSGPSEVRARGGMLLCRASAWDGETEVQLTFFNNRFISQMLRPGEAYLFRGKLTQSGGRWAMASPAFVAQAKAPGLEPVYPATQGLSSRQVAAAVQAALKLLPENMRDSLPQALREKHALCHLGYALERIHRPRDQEELAVARRRLVFEEFLILQLGLMQIKSGRREENLHRASGQYPEDFARLLPFQLTGAQQRAIAQGVKDMAGASPMNRLVQGDVGSGKTAVAAALCWVAVHSGWQAALMAPTEILAAQHYQSLSALLEPAGVRCALLTGSLTPKEHRAVQQAIAAGEVDLAIGTHALISQKVSFRDLGLVITDEQHRFGVNQRAALAQKGASPHLLVMSATPIPRTLALMAYGDLDISVLDELPPGRQPVETYLIGPDKRDRAFQYVRRRLDEGRQGYLICPLITEGETGMMSLDQYESLVRKTFPGVPLEVLHGKMKPAQKDRAMENFAQGRARLLVATTVVEVGVDVPNAAVMVIENAERYGLSQLHQLRGRIGRGGHKSACILINSSPETLERLRLFKSTTDGFAIADADLKLRGPGDFFGQRQHGLPPLKIAGMWMDMELLREAQKCARRVFYSGALEDGEYRALRAETRRLFEKTGGARVAL